METRKQNGMDERRTGMDERRTGMDGGLTGLTVNSCFFLPPPCVPYYIKYIYTYFYICVGGGVCIFGVLTVNLLTSDADNED